MVLVENDLSVHLKAKLDRSYLILHKVMISDNLPGIQNSWKKIFRHREETKKKQEICTLLIQIAHLIIPYKLAI